MALHVNGSITNERISNVTSADSSGRSFRLEDSLGNAIVVTTYRAGVQLTSDEVAYLRESVQALWANNRSNLALDDLKDKLTKSSTEWYKGLSARSTQVLMTSWNEQTRTMPGYSEALTGYNTLKGIAEGRAVNKSLLQQGSSKAGAAVRNNAKVGTVKALAFAASHAPLVGPVIKLAITQGYKAAKAKHAAYKSRKLKELTLNGQTDEQILADLKNLIQNGQIQDIGAAHKKFRDSYRNLDQLMFGKGIDSCGDVIMLFYKSRRVVERKRKTIAKIDTLLLVLTNLKSSMEGVEQDIDNAGESVKQTVISFVQDHQISGQPCSEHHIRFGKCCLLLEGSLDTASQKLIGADND